MISRPSDPLTISVEQSSGCYTETGDDTVHFQATTQGLSVLHPSVDEQNEHRPALLWCLSCVCAAYKTANSLTYSEDPPPSRDGQAEETCVTPRWFIYI